ncbi:MAG: O-antigen ligase family protein [Bacteroidia bacterium]
MSHSLKLKWFYISGLVFILLNSIAIAFEFYWLSALPLLLALVLLTIYRLDILLLLLVFLIPLSINIENIGFGLGISLPAEPFVIGVFLLTIFKFIIDGTYDYRVFKHPISIAILINLLWILICCFFSEYKLVSFKFFLSRTWFITVFFFLCVVLFKKLYNVELFLWSYIIPLAAVIIYTLINHSADNFSQISSFEVMSPFYVAHGIYSAAIAFFIPFLLGYVLLGFKIKAKPLLALLATALFFLFSIGVIFSYTRAAWVSIAAGAVFAILLILRIKLWQILVVLFFASYFLMTNFTDIYFRLYQNKAKSTEGINQHAESIANVRNDVSNLERINRWVSAVNMVKAKPIFGFGPGAYSFTYAPYQEPEYKTQISTSFGDQGHAHSEYLNLLSETGWIGLITFLIALYFLFKTGMKLVYTADDIKVRFLASSILIGMVTYLTHGLLNSYSEQDKIAVFFWGSFAIITALDLYHNKKIERN